MTHQCELGSSVFEPNHLEGAGFFKRVARAMVHAAEWCSGPLRPCAKWCIDLDLDTIEREEAFRREVQREQCHAYRLDGAVGLDSLDIALALQAYKGDPIHAGGVTVFQNETSDGDADSEPRDSAHDGQVESSNGSQEPAGAGSRTNSVQTVVVGDVVVPLATTVVGDVVVDLIAGVQTDSLNNTHRGRVVAAACVVKLVEQRCRVLRDRAFKPLRGGRGGKVGKPTLPDSIPMELRGRLTKRARVVNPAIVAGVKLAVVAKIGHRPDNEANRMVVETVARRVMLDRGVHPDTQAVYLERVVDAYFTANNYNIGAGWYRRRLRGWRAWIANTATRDAGMTTA